MRDILEKDVREHWVGRRDINGSTNKKKRCFKTQLKCESQSHYGQCRRAKQNVKHLTKKVKEIFWCRYREYLTDFCKTSPTNFFSSANSMRVADESYNTAVTAEMVHQFSKTQTEKPARENIFKNCITLKS